MHPDVYLPYNDAVSCRDHIASVADELNERRATVERQSLGKTYVLEGKSVELLLFLLILVKKPPPLPKWVRASSFTRFLDHTQRRTTLGRIPLDEWLVRRRDLYLKTHNTHNTQTPTPPVGFELTISAGERLQTYALNRVATGTGQVLFCPP